MSLTIGVEVVLGQLDRFQCVGVAGRLDGLAVCRMLRAEPDPRLCDVPIVMLTGVKLTEADLVEAFVAGATDYLTKPVKPTLVRSRVRAWLSRTATV